MGLLEKGVRRRSQRVDGDCEHVFRVLLHLPWDPVGAHANLVRGARRDDVKKFDQCVPWPVVAFDAVVEGVWRMDQGAVAGETEITGPGVAEAMVDAHRPDIFVLNVLHGSLPDSDLEVRSGRGWIREGRQKRRDDRRLRQRLGLKHNGRDVLYRGYQILGLP